jgi:hypothetical protein
MQPIHEAFGTPEKKFKGACIYDYTYFIKSFFHYYNGGVNNEKIKKDLLNYFIYGKIDNFENFLNNTTKNNLKKLFNSNKIRLLQGNKELWGGAPINFNSSLFIPIKSNGKQSNMMISPKKSLYFKKFSVKQSEETKKNLENECEVYSYLREKDQKFIENSTFFVECYENGILLKNGGNSLKKMLKANTFYFVKDYFDQFFLKLYQLHNLLVTHNDLHVGNVVGSDIAHFIDFGLAEIHPVEVLDLNFLRKIYNAFSGLFLALFNKYYNENDSKTMNEKNRVKRYKQKLTSLTLNSNILDKFNKQCEDDFRRMIASFLKISKNQRGGVGKFPVLNMSFLNSLINNKTGEFKSFNNQSQKSTPTNLLSDQLKNKNTSLYECQIYEYLQRNSPKFINESTCFERCSSDSLFLRKCGISFQELILENKNNISLFIFILEKLLLKIHHLHLLGVAHNNLDCSHVLVGKREMINTRNIDVRLINFSKATILEPRLKIDSEFLTNIFYHYYNYCIQTLSSKH